MAAALDVLAQRAYNLYRAPGVDAQKYLHWLTEAYRIFVHECGGVYTEDYEVSLAPGVWQYDLPTDVRQLKPNGVFLHYLPRAIAQCWRASNVVTIQTALPHKLSVGVKVVIAGVTKSSFNGAFTVSEVVSDVLFRYPQNGVDEGSSGGTVSSLNSGVRFLAFARQEDMLARAWVADTTGRPSWYFFLDALRICLYEIPDGTDPVLMLHYDAEAPETLDVSQALPVPAYVEPGLIGYAHAQAAAQAGDAAREQRGMVLFAAAQARWNAAASARRQVDVASVLEDELEVE